MWWVGGSQLVNVWAIWSVDWKETLVAPDIRYILPAAHTIEVWEKQLPILWTQIVIVILCCCLTNLTKMAHHPSVHIDISGFINLKEVAAVHPGIALSPPVRQICLTMCCDVIRPSLWCKLTGTSIMHVCTSGISIRFFIPESYFLYLVNLITSDSHKGQ